MKNILFLGYVVNPEEANNTFGASIAGNKMQWNLIKNISKNKKVQISCVTITPKATFPREMPIFQRKKEEKLFSNVKNYRISYINLPILKQFCQIINVYRTARKIIEKNEIDILFCFNLFPQVGIPMRWLNKKNKSLNTACLLADLPIDDNTKRKGISFLLRKCMEKSTWKNMDICNKYIVLNKNVIDKYLFGKKYIVIDGGISDNDINKYKNLKKIITEKNIIFSGALASYNGINNLLKSMNMIKDIDVFLDIYGSGYLEEQVKDAVKNNDKIRYHGQVPNEIVMKKQQEGWLLINPRIINDPITKVTFPSKTFEYLLSGTPVLSTKLEAYGKEYENVMFFSEDDTPEMLSKSIRKIYKMENKELLEKGRIARNFVIKEKSWDSQTKKILSFLLENEEI